MFCRNCAKELDDRAVACTGCGLQPMAGNKFCHNCKHETIEAATFCIKCGLGFAMPATSGTVPGADKKIAAGVLGLVLGSLGIHKFVLGYTTEGLIMLLVTVLSLGLGSIVMWPIGIVEGIIYLSKSDQEFVATYVQAKKGCF